LAGVNVLYLNHTAVLGGAEHSLMTLLAARAQSARARLAAPSGPLEQAAAEINVPFDRIYSVEASLQLRYLDATRAAIAIGRSAIRLASLVQIHDVHVVHANTTRAGLMATAARRLRRRPLVIHLRDCLPPGRLSHAVRAILAGQADALVATSRYVAQRFTAGLASGRIAPVRVIDNPVDLERFAPRGSAVRTESPLLVVIGQITPWKGQDTAIRALPAVLSRLPDARLEIVGEVKFSSKRFDNHSYLRTLTSLVSGLGLDRHVSFTGERNDVDDIMRRADAVLVPSSEEPFGRTVAEAMAVGTPVIATTVGGPAELISDGVNGLLAPPADPGAWSRAICRLADDPELGARLASRALLDARARFDPGRIAREVVALQREVVAGAPRR
jgi:glycosyltransferase involved in cell wall biosynthesis